MGQRQRIGFTLARSCKTDLRRHVSKAILVTLQISQSVTVVVHASILYYSQKVTTKEFVFGEAPILVTDLKRFDWMVRCVITYR
jgi:hypothetical protein